MQGKGTKIRSWTGDVDDRGRQVYVEHQGRTQVYDTKELWAAAIQTDTFHKWQYQKFFDTSPLLDVNGLLYTRDNLETWGLPWRN